MWTKSKKVLGIHAPRPRKDANQCKRQELKGGYGDFTFISHDTKGVDGPPGEKGWQGGGKEKAYI